MTIEQQKDRAYWERNQLVAALSKIFPAWLGKHPKEDKEWDEEWRNIVFMEIPSEYRDVSGQDFPHQISWHIHDFDLPMFDHLSFWNSKPWDGHDTQEKYRRLRAITPSFQDRIQKLNQ